MIDRCKAQKRAGRQLASVLYAVLNRKLDHRRPFTRKLELRAMAAINRARDQRLI